MSTAIEWTDETWNPVVGCSIISPGCHNCYAMPMAFRLRAMALTDIAAGRNPGRKRHYIDAVDENGRWTGKLIPVPEALSDPFEWKRPRMIFVNSMSDLFHESLPFEFIDRVFSVMNATVHTLPITPDSGRWHTYQVLTKRADRLREYSCSRRTASRRNGDHPLIVAGRGEGGALRGRGLEVMNAGAVVMWPPPNVWFGVSVENQKQKSRIEELRNTPAAVRFLSCEPLLEDLGTIDLTGIDWVIVGGESGHKARIMQLEWARSIRDQCVAAGVAFHFKQHGEWCAFSQLPTSTLAVVDIDRKPMKSIGQHSYHKVGKHAASRVLDGRTWDEFPRTGAVHV